MPTDVDDVPTEGWAFWCCVAVSAAVVVGASLDSSRWWVTVLGMLAVLGALDQVTADIARSRKRIARRARLAEQDRIRDAMRAAARARLDELNRRQP